MYGDLPASEVSGKLEGKTVEVLSGEPFTGFTKTGNKATIKKVRWSSPMPTMSAC